MCEVMIRIPSTTPLVFSNLRGFHIEDFSSINFKILGIKIMLKSNSKTNIWSNTQG
jgi:hypothetical protein